MIGQCSNFVAVSVTSQQYSNFKFYAQHAAAAYCNYNTPAGDYIECGGECDALENNWVYSVGSMTYVKLPMLDNTIKY